MHFLGTHEGKGRGSGGKKGRYSNLTKGDKVKNNGGLTDLWVSSTLDNNEKWYESLCESEGHYYNPSTGMCVRCYQRKSEAEK